jgi:hypothetical protein
MMKAVKVLCVVVMLVGLVSFSGCGTPEQGRASGAPGWVSRGSGEFPGDRGRALYAVGMAGYDPNPRMQDLVAKNTGRTEMARQMETYVANLIKDFMQSHKDFADPSSASSIQFVQSVSKSVTEATLRGSKMVDSWRDPESKTLYVLMRMDLKDMMADVQSTAQKKAREQQANLFKAKTDEALKALDAELEKRKKAVEGE